MFIYYVISIISGTIQNNVSFIAKETTVPKIFYSFFLAISIAIGITNHKPKLNIKKFVFILY